MEEKDQQPADPGSSNKPVEQSPQLPDSIDTKDTSDQTTSLQEPVPKTMVQDEAENPKTTNQKPQTSDMEVHHHGHVHEKKKWKEYLFQFLMLFLAITLGFFVENQREHYVEHQRAKQYAITLISDLKADTTDLKTILERYSVALKNVDTFLLLISKSKPEEIESGKLYWYGLWGGYKNSFIQNDATFQQMRNSGSLRYFTNKYISLKIARYDQVVRKMQTLNNADLPFELETRKLRAQLFDFKYNNAANKLVLASAELNNFPRIDSFMKSRPLLISYDKVAFNEYAEFCRVRTRTFVFILRYQQEALQLAIELIEELKKEYNLE